MSQSDHKADCVAGSCVCYSGYTLGPSTGLCDTHSPVDVDAGLCSGHSCQHGGSCVERVNALTGADEAVCVCVSGWIGDSCQTGSFSLVGELPISAANSARSVQTAKQITTIITYFFPALSAS